ncbi:MAG: patatin-like phospholipase family protein [Porticoccaceae bacterium]
MTTALVLSGGGARAAYQVGVLKAVSEILPETAYSPFPIICGTSAGAINTLALAGRRGSFAQRILAVEKIWRSLRAEDVYCSSFFRVAANTMKLGTSLVFSGLGIAQPQSLLDNSPLRRLLARVVNFRDIDEAIASNYLKAVAITAMSYNTGQSITFFQGDHDNWRRARRLGVRTGLTLDHLMASAAIPTMFPPVRIGDGYFGDGAVRQLKPLSPAIRLGAERLFIVGVSDNPVRGHVAEEPCHAPSVAQTMGHLLNSAFIDTIESDLETLRAINRLYDSICATNVQDPAIADIKKIDYVSITPSVAINDVAAQYFCALPRSMRLFLRMTGATGGTGGASAVSYLMFEQGFCCELIDMGYQDALRQQQEIQRFFSLSEEVAPAEERGIATSVTAAHST